MTALQSVKIHITGTVQGVGFRPFVYNLATRYNLAGWVQNTSAGVDIEAEGVPDALETFIRALRHDPPPLARIDTFELTSQPSQGYNTFEIIHSASHPEDFIPISPDVSICSDCLHELFDPTNQRYRYPFINCTNCGPRFTIIEDIPYDRPNTTMAGFHLCPDCDKEYHDPANRRFHAQPVACPICGPKVWLEYPAADHQTTFSQSTTIKNQPLESSDEAIQKAQQLLQNGKTIAIKGLGGFHLACDATNPEAVTGLRQRKLRVDKPFAVMMPDIATVERQCIMNETERELLLSRQRPIVILRRRSGSGIVPHVAPGQDTVGVMLPYTPLHYLLFADFNSSSDLLQPYAYVMTSGNLSEEPIATDNEDARQRLAGLCDAFLMHDRPIRTRCDDSVVRVALDQDVLSTSISVALETYAFFTRRSRGYAPDPIHLPFEMTPILATGPELKNTFCLARGPYAFLSHHIGDLENYETLQSFEGGVAQFEQLFRIHPMAIACDLHPNYLATRYAQERARREELPLFGIQHHHAHIAACMADNGLPGTQPVIGVAFDGTGYGTDGAIWGGEFLLADYHNFQRAAHLAEVPLPGGDAATRQPWRVAMAWLDKCGMAWDWDIDLAPVRAATSSQLAGIETIAALQHQLAHHINTPMTTSMGRLFDAIAALAGVREVVNYEAQAAIELEAMADPLEKGVYRFNITSEKAQGNKEPDPNLIVYIIDPTPLLGSLLTDLKKRMPLPVISARFHNGVAEMVRDVVAAIRQETGVSQVALSGGVWQNTTLLTKTVVLLQDSGFEILLHRQVPPNDGGIALGQAVIAQFRYAAQA
jgi:hydrogenase maturation protein HypF